MKMCFKPMVFAVLFTAISLTSMQHVRATASIGIVELLRNATVKVIRAIDLKIQRLQNKTIWLQNAQKTLENTMSKMKLQDIADWTEKQREQYREYFDELAKVKTSITYYQRIREVTSKQVRLVNEYSRVWNLLQRDSNFSPDELQYMGKVYTGILKESMRNLEQISLVIRSFSLQMNDAKRIELIDTAADQIDQNFDDLMVFNRQNVMLSLRRTKSQQEAEVIKKLYGLEK